MEKKIAVIGAGPAGLTAAYTLAKEKFPVTLYEASSAVGGLAKSIQLWGQTVDLGPHRFFSRDRRVNEVWLELAGTDYRIVERQTRILYRNKFYEYPLQLPDVLRNLGLLEATHSVLSYAAARTRRAGDDESFADWICKRFGRRLFEIFFKTYSEKLWGIPCDQLDADFAEQRIRQFSLLAALKAALSKNHAARHRTLADRFAYPTGGTGLIYRRMEDAIRKWGGCVRLETPVKRVVTQDGNVRGIELGDGTFQEHDQVISSMPLTVLAKQLPEAPASVAAAANQLNYRNTILVYVEVAHDNICDDNWIYIHSPELKTGRITNFRNWAPELFGDSKNTIVAMEYWCNDGDKMWSAADEDLIRLARRELLATELVDNESLISNACVYRIPKCYPVYRRGYKKLLEPIQSYVASVSGLQAIGRYGSFKYNNQDHSILMGLLAAENVLAGSRHDLWKVNADDEMYQEAWLISETGLTKCEGSPQPNGSSVGSSSQPDLTRAGIV